ncbi:Oligopeptide transport system permease protein OppC [Anaerolineales bacterium]|nr:Oligopeptide transport system permease protein OppC [Anaerolineales bacterium]
MKEIKRSFRELLRYPTAIASMVMIFAAALFSIYTMITIPYDEAVRLWRGSEDDWYQYPKQAAPAWMNYFADKKQPVSFFLNSANPEFADGGTVTRDVETRQDGTSKVTITYAFDFQYDDFPQDIILYADVKNATKKPLVGVTWLTPDGRKVNMVSYSISQRNVYRISLDDKLARILRADRPIEGLFADPASDKPVPLKGTYQMVVAVSLFEPEADADVELVLHGTLYGMAGTDFKRRDLMIPLMWGMPIALAFGLLAALGTTVTTLVIAAIGTWYGGWVDDLIQRITEINSVLPFYPILIMIGTFYSRSIWLILGATILLNIFGLGIKNFRAIFLQIKESPYIEAARSYGASDGRIIIRYLTPRVIPLLIPQLVTLVPGYVFLEAGLAVLGLGDPFMPTWGKVIDDARTNGALFEGLYYWILEPAALLLVTGLAFALLGFALDRVFNPKLREM